MILLEQKGFIPPIPDLLDGCNVLEVIEFDTSKKPPPEVAERVVEIIKKYEKSTG